MALIILRSVFIMVACGLATFFFRSGMQSGPPWAPAAIVAGVLLMAAVVIGVDVLLPRKRIQTISAIYFGILIGLALTYALNIAISPLLEFVGYRDTIQTGIGLVICYVCVSLLLQTKDDFRFLIPYVEFAKEIKGLKPCILDTSVIIDGRIAELVDTEIFDNQLIVPRFVLSELQGIADSSDKLRRSRGRRGLDVVQRLLDNPKVDVQIFDRELEDWNGQTVDMRLVLLARHVQGKIITGDFNLNKVARVHNIPVVNLNDVANALKPDFLPGESFDVRIVKPGESIGQGVGYLDDGTMIVVEGAREHVNETVRVCVTNLRQTSAGRIIFGRFEQVVP